MLRVETRELIELIDELVGPKPLGAATGHNGAALRAIHDIRTRGRTYTTYWRADTVCTALGHPEAMQYLNFVGTQRAPNRKR